MWFKKKVKDIKEKMKERQPESGDVYMIYHESSPWKKKETKAKVIETLDGWIKYRFMYGDEVSENDQEDKIKTFLSIFNYVGKE